MNWNDPMKMNLLLIRVLFNGKERSLGTIIIFNEGEKKCCCAFRDRFENPIPDNFVIPVCARSKFSPHFVGMSVVKYGLGGGKHVVCFHESRRSY